MKRLILLLAAVSLSTAAEDRAAWMRDARWGVMTHYLADWIARAAGEPMTVERWKTLSEGDQRIDREEARKVGDQLRRDIPGQDEQAIKVMSARGLRIVNADRAEWRAVAEQLVVTPRSPQP